MKCADCPFSLTCLRGRLGQPFEIRLCPKCGCLSFIVEERFLVDINQYSNHPLPGRVEERKNAHIFIFECERRPVPKQWRQRWIRMCVREKDTTGTLGITISDPGPGNQPLVQIRPCVACAGQFDRAGFYWKVHFHQLDQDDEMPKL